MCEMCETKVIEENLPYVFTPKGKYKIERDKDAGICLITVPNEIIIRLRSEDFFSPLKSCGNFAELRYSTKFVGNRVVFISPTGVYLDISSSDLIGDTEIDQETGNLLVPTKQGPVWNLPEKGHLFQTNSQL